jgi:uridine kinase
MRIIGLSGGSGSGKTTIAKQIISMFPEDFASLLPMDAYYKDHSHLRAEDKLIHNFDHPDSFDFNLLLDHLRTLRKHQPVARPVYSYVTCSREPTTVSVYPSELIILEGLLALSDEQIGKEVDLKIYLDVNEENRFERIVERDFHERGRSREKAMERFYQTVHPMHKLYVEPLKSLADIVIDGNYPDPLFIAREIAEKLKEGVRIIKSKV